MSFTELKSTNKKNVWILDADTDSDDVDADDDRDMDDDDYDNFLSRSYLGEGRVRGLRIVFLWAAALLLLLGWFGRALGATAAAFRRHCQSKEYVKHSIS